MIILLYILDCIPNGREVVFHPIHTEAILPSTAHIDETGAPVRPALSFSSSPPFLCGAERAYITSCQVHMDQQSGKVYGTPRRGLATLRSLSGCRSRSMYGRSYFAGEIVAAALPTATLTHQQRHSLSFGDIPQEISSCLNSARYKAYLTLDAIVQLDLSIVCQQSQAPPIL